MKVTAPNELELKFDRLADRWRAETAHLSRLDSVYLNFDYQQIIGMGDVALPFIFKALSDKSERWFWALKAITGHEPHKGAEGVSMEEMRTAWLTWGSEHGLL